MYNLCSCVYKFVDYFQIMVAVTLVFIIVVVASPIFEVVGLIDLIGLIILLLLVVDDDDDDDEVIGEIILLLFLRRVNKFEFVKFKVNLKSPFKPDIIDDERVS